MGLVRGVIVSQLEQRNTSFGYGGNHSFSPYLFVTSKNYVEFHEEKLTGVKREAMYSYDRIS